MATLLMTGFPGFLGAALLPRLLARDAEQHAVCLVQGKFLAQAQERLRAIEADHPDTAGRVTLLVGDITADGLGIAAEDAPTEQVGEVWHLAAVYDLSVAEEVAQAVNVVGTANVLRFCAGLPQPPRLHYASTVVVSGRYDGRFMESDLEAGESFQNHYESTKHEAERLVRAAMADGLPATIYRPGIVVGDSTTGQTQKYDGPYMVATYLHRQPPGVAFLPSLDPTLTTPLVPRDFVIDAMVALSTHPGADGKTYALTDPDPPTNVEVAKIMAGHLHRRIVWLPIPVAALRGALGTVPGAEKLTGLTAEALDYFTFPTSYDTTNTQTDLTGTGVTCPRFPDYAGRLLDYMAQHPEFDATAMV